MNKINVLFSLILTCMIGFPRATPAAPSLPITKPPVTPNPSNTGPTNDTSAITGQWFMDISTSSPTNRTHEFYDNTTNAGGGGLGSLAIAGHVTNVTYNFFNSNIMSFDVDAVISNDAPAAPAWANGTNSLNETRSSGSQYTNTLKQVILTANFAFTGDESGNAVQPEWTPPFHDIAPHVITVNHDYAAWFCWTPNTTNVNGGYFVPGWAFGDIPPNSASTRTLNFFFPGSNFSPSDGLPPSDARYGAIMESFTNGADIFINRSRSLKISEWISDLAVDPTDSSSTNSNVSVFHNIQADPSQTITIKSIQYITSPPTVLLTSVGCSNAVSRQIVQVNTNLLYNNWLNVATNEAALPAPNTNTWEHSNVTGSAHFYRIVQ